MSEPGCRDLLSLSHDIISNVQHWCGDLAHTHTHNSCSSQRCQIELRSGPCSSALKPCLDLVVCTGAKEKEQTQTEIWFTCCSIEWVIWRGGPNYHKKDTKVCGQQCPLSFICHLHAHAHVGARTVTRSRARRAHPSPLSLTSLPLFLLFLLVFVFPHLFISLLVVSLLQAGLLLGKHQAVAPCVAASSPTK